MITQIVISQILDNYPPPLLPWGYPETLLIRQEAAFVRLFAFMGHFAPGGVGGFPLRQHVTPPTYTNGSAPVPSSVICKILLRPEVPLVCLFMTEKNSSVAAPGATVVVSKRSVSTPDSKTSACTT